MSYILVIMQHAMKVLELQLKHLSVPPSDLSQLVVVSESDLTTTTAVGKPALIVVGAEPGET